MGKLFFIMGVAGAGKGTLVKNLSNLENNNFVFPLSYRSRQIRENEVNGVDSWFVTREEFEKSIENKEFLEYAVVHGKDYYGTKLYDIMSGINSGKIVIKELDMWGLKKLQKENIEFRKYYKTIFLSIPPSMIKQRIETRGVLMIDEELERRLESAKIELSDSKEICDYIVDTSDKTPEEVLSDVLNIIKKEV